MKEGTDNKESDDKVVTFDPKRKRKLKELPPQKQRQPRQLMASLNTDKENQAEYFDDCYVRLLRIQARIIDNEHEPSSEKQETRLEKLLDLEEEALWDVIHARGIQRWQIRHKLQLLEELLHESRNWIDQRDFFLLARARMDLARLEPLKAAQRFTGETGDDAA